MDVYIRHIAGSLLPFSSQGTRQERNLQFYLQLAAPPLLLLLLGLRFFVLHLLLLLRAYLLHIVLTGKLCF